MILVEKSLEIIHGVSVRPETEVVPLNQALGRILAQDIVSKINLPPFNKSAMDGYAFHSDDSSEGFQIVETIPAGVVPAQYIKKGQCAKIMTGGMVPKGADRVIKRELIVEENGFMRIVEEEKNRNICFLGEDVKIGDVVLKKGVSIRPQEIGVIASMGMAQLKVYKKPQVGIMATGSELVEPGQAIQGGNIYNSNSYSLAAQVRQTGAELKSSSLVVDKKEKIHLTLKKLLEACDIILISGGVSAGDFDYVPAILKELGVQIHFEKVSIQPGKPTVFGTLQEKIVFGVPGNPVSTFVIFEIFIKPMLYRMMGHDFHPEMIQGILQERFCRRNTVRSAYIPVRCREGLIEALSYHGSAHIHALCRANGLMNVPRGVKEIPKGSKVNVRQI